MKSLRKNIIYLIALIFSLGYMGLMGYLSRTSAKLESTMSQHGFDRGVVISINNDEGSVNDDEAQNVISSGPNIKDGALALLSRAALKNLLSMPQIDSVMAVAKSSWQLSLHHGLTTEVGVLNVPPTFMSTFHLGSPDFLKPGEYVPTEGLANKLMLTSASTPAIFSIPNDTIAALPSEMRNHIDWSQAQVPVIVKKQTVGLPAGVSFFETILFTTGREPKVSIPGLFLLPNVSVFVKFRDDVDISQATNQLAQFLETAAPADPKMHLTMIPLTQYFAEQLGAETVAVWSKNIRIGFYGASITLVTMLALLYYGRVRYEIALRRALGTPLSHSVWLSVKPTIGAITKGIFSGLVISAAFITIALDLEVSKLLVDVTPLISITLVAVSALYGGARLSCSVDAYSIVKLKS